MSAKRVASMAITVHMEYEGGPVYGFEVEIPDFDGSEFARTFGRTAADALQVAGSYVESVLFDAASGGGRLPLSRPLGLGDTERER